jgi:cell division septation protein DedD
MGPVRESKRDERGLSARYLVVVFLMGVAACAVFFSLGFLVGYNERPFKGAPSTEQVTSPPLIPPTVNPPLEEIPSPEKKPAPATTTKPATEAKPATSSATTPSGQVPTGIAVQVAASRSKPDAESLVKELSSRGYPVFLVTPEYAKAGDNLYRVQVGPFATREDAEKTRDKLVEEGFKPFIRQ